VKIAVLGTGMVGRSLSSRLGELGHDVVIGTRDPQATLDRPHTDAEGDTSFADWQASHPDVRLQTFAEAAAHGDVVVNAVAGAVSAAVLEEAGASNLAGKVLLDISNPLDFSAGMPPTLFVKDSDSLAERLQRAFPQTRVVKSLNTLNAYLMVNPKELGVESSVFVSGDDAAAKAVVVELLTSFGHTDVIDLGDLSTARGPEMLLPLWLRLWGALGTPMFNIKVVR
jgi:predicted dinucleotide-binding enzyme